MAVGLANLLGVDPLVGLCTGSIPMVEMCIRDRLDALNRGIAMVHQELQPIPARTVAENIWLGRYPTKGQSSDKEFHYFFITVHTDKRKNIFFLPVP